VATVVGWTLVWRSFAARIADGMDVQAAALREEGYTAGWKARTITGYPFRYRVVLTDATIGEPTGWGVAMPRLEAEAAAYNPSVVVLVAPQGLRLSRPGKPVLEVGGEALRMSLGGLPSPLPRISVEGVGVTLKSAGAPPAFSGVERIEARLRPQDDGGAQVFFRLDRADATPDTMLATITSGEPVTLAIDGVATQANALQGRGWAGILQGWSEAGGVFNTASGGLEAGTALVSIRRGALSVDPTGRLAGELALSLQSAPQAVLSMGAVGVLPDDTAAVATGLAGVRGGGQESFDLTFGFRDGQTWLGPLPLGEAPRLY